MANLLKTYVTKINVFLDNGEKAVFFGDYITAHNANEANMILQETGRGYMKTNEDQIFVEEVSFGMDAINQKQNDN